MNSGGRTSSRAAAFPVDGPPSSNHFFQWKPPGDGGREFSRSRRFAEEFPEGRRSSATIPSDMQYTREFRPNRRMPQHTPAAQHFHPAATHPNMQRGGNPANLSTNLYTTHPYPEGPPPRQPLQSNGPATAPPPVNRTNPPELLSPPYEAAAATPHPRAFPHFPPSPHFPTSRPAAAVHPSGRSSAGDYRGALLSGSPQGPYGRGGAGGKGGPRGPPQAPRPQRPALLREGPEPGGGDSPGVGGIFDAEDRRAGEWEEDERREDGNKLKINCETKQNRDISICGNFLMNEVSNYFVFHYYKVISNQTSYFGLYRNTAWWSRFSDVVKHDFSIECVGVDELQATFNDPKRRQELDYFGCFDPQLELENIYTQPTGQDGLLICVAGTLRASGGMPRNKKFSQVFVLRLENHAFMIENDSFWFVHLPPGTPTEETHFPIRRQHPVEYSDFSYPRPQDLPDGRRRFPPRREEPQEERKCRPPPDLPSSQPVKESMVSTSREVNGADRPNWREGESPQYRRPAAALRGGREGRGLFAAPSDRTMNPPRGGGRGRGRDTGGDKMMAMGVDSHNVTGRPHIDERNLMPVETSGENPSDSGNRQHPENSHYGRQHPENSHYGRQHPENSHYGRQRPENSHYGRQRPGGRGQPRGRGSKASDNLPTNPHISSSGAVVRSHEEGEVGEDAAPVNAEGGGTSSNQMRRRGGRGKRAAGGGGGEAASRGGNRRRGGGHHPSRGGGGGEHQMMKYRVVHEGSTPKPTFTPKLP